MPTFTPPVSAATRADELRLEVGRRYRFWIRHFGALEARFAGFPPGDRSLEVSRDERGRSYIFAADLWRATSLPEPRS